MPRIGSFELSRRTKYKLELNYVIRVAVNKRVFEKPNSPTFASPRRAHKILDRKKKNLAGQKKRNQAMFGNNYFIQMHLWREKLTLKTGPHTVLTHEDKIFKVYFTYCVISHFSALDKLFPDRFQMTLCWDFVE